MGCRLWRCWPPIPPGKPPPTPPPMPPMPGNPPPARCSSQAEPQAPLLSLVQGQASLDTGGLGGFKARTAGVALTSSGLEAHVPRPAKAAPSPAPAEHRTRTSRRGCPATARCLSLMRDRQARIGLPQHCCAVQRPRRRCLTQGGTDKSVACVQRVTPWLAWKWKACPPPIPPGPPGPPGPPPCSPSSPKRSYVCLFSGSDSVSYAAAICSAAGRSVRSPQGPTASHTQLLFAVVLDGDPGPAEPGSRGEPKEGAQDAACL